MRTGLAQRSIYITGDAHWAPVRIVINVEDSHTRYTVRDIPATPASPATEHGQESPDKVPQSNEQKQAP